MYLTEPTDKYWVLDIETDDFEATQIWVVCVKNVVTGEELDFRDRESFNLFDRSDHIYVGHNILSFDWPCLERLWNAGPRRLIDTLALSYLYNPHMPGGHSLQEWGERLKFPKGDFSDWSHYSEEMVEYCKRDVELTLRVYRAIGGRMAERGFSEKSCEIEHKIREIINVQQRNGFKFDLEGARLLRDQLESRQGVLAETIHKLFPPELAELRTYKKSTRADGSPTVKYLEHLVAYPRIRTNLDGTYTAYDWKEFKISSPLQRIEKLLSLGWKPTRRTEAGTPQVDEDSLLEFAESKKCPNPEEVRAIANWLVAFGRYNMVGTWLNYYNEDTGCIHGEVFTCGAQNRRMTHARPNTANIPKARPKVQYGREARALWTARPNRVLVGADAKGLEMRCFGHYLISMVGESTGRPVADLYISGDPHARNASLWGLEPEARDAEAKNGFYAYIYGAQAKKLGRTLKKDTEFGKWAGEVLESETPGLKELREEIGKEFRQGGFLQTIDGGFVRPHAEYQSINYKLSSAGAILMKQASIFMDQKVKENGYDTLKVGDIHDEWQFDTDPKCSDEVGKAACLSISEAGEELGFRVPMAGDFKVGATWAETH